ncbi:MAG TPA: glucokinase [Myxococcaceae bacterium]|nr:glucokinase [Myxococcaceae bacterium]
MIVAGDIGGTNARLATFEVQAGRLLLIREITYPSRSAPDLEGIVRRFVQETRPSATAAALGVAGPVKDGRIETPNLPWVVDARRLGDILAVRKVTLLNDLKANAYGLRHLGPTDFAILQAGAHDAVGNQAILSAGTGLGCAGLYWDGQRHRPFATEGGHADFAPRNHPEAELMEDIAREKGRVSAERILSGSGLVRIYRFLRKRSGVPEPPALTELFAKEDPAAVVSRSALGGLDPICVQALEMFVSAYGAEAGNVALRMLATGGVFLGGGIAPKNLPAFQRDELFMAAFLNKGRMRALLETVPVLVVLNDRAALWGAAHCAGFDES